MHPETYRLAPELTVTNLSASLAFWRDLIGFAVAYDRPDEGFAFLTLGPLSLMLEQASSAARTWSTGDMEHPYGRGINFELTVPQLDPILQRLAAAQHPFFMEPEVKTYRTGDASRTVRQCLVQDPDGYLLRLAEVLVEN